MAGGWGVQPMAPATAGHVYPERQGARCADASAPTVRPGELGDADGRKPETARLPPRRAPGSIAARLRGGPPTTGVFSQTAAATTEGCPRVSQPDVAPGSDVRAAREARRGLLRDERCAS